MHSFELKTTNLEYYVGVEENSSVEINAENSSNYVWTKDEKNWESIIQHALMPVPSNSTSKYIILKYLESHCFDMQYLTCLLFSYCPKRICIITLLKACVLIPLCLCVVCYML